MAQPKNQYLPQGGKTKKQNIIYILILILCVFGLFFHSYLLVSTTLNPLGLALMEAFLILSTIIVIYLLISNS